MFDDHITVESPGTLPRIVRLNNMREVHFSRNPKIAGLPEYRTEAFMVYATIRNKRFVDEKQGENKDNTQDNIQDNTQVKILKYCMEPRSKQEITAFLGYKDARGVARNHIKPLLEEGKLMMTIPDKPNSRKQKYIAK